MTKPTKPKGPRLIRKQTFHRLCRARGVDNIETIPWILERDVRGIERTIHLYHDNDTPNPLYEGRTRREVWTEELIESLLMYQYAWHKDRDRWIP